MREVAYSSPFVPPEWIAAHGLSPVRLAPEASAVPPPAGVCPFAHDFVQALTAPGGGGPAGAVFASSCDPMRRFAEFAARHVPTFLMHVPATWQTPDARRLYVSELKLLADFLISVGGTRPTEEGLVGTVLAFDARRRQEGAVETSGGAMRVALTGGPMRARDRWIIEHLARGGATIVLDATEYAMRTVPAAIDEGRLRAGPLDEMARAYFLAIPDPFRRPDSLLHEYLAERLAATGAQALLVLRPLCCDQWHAQVGRLKAALRVPVVDVELPLHEGDRARTMARLDALLELLR